MEVKSIAVLATPGGKPVSAGHFCTVRLLPPNKRGEILVEITPNRRVGKKVARPSGRYLLEAPGPSAGKEAEKIDSQLTISHT